MKKIFVRAMLCIVFVFVANAQASYLPVPVGANSGYVEVYDTARGLNYGKARIEYRWWLDQPSGYWHYAYQVFNNDYFGTPANKDDDYHFGYVYDSDVTLPDSINKFDVVFNPASGINDLLVLDTAAGSTKGGGGWAHSPGFNVLTGLWTSMDWTVTGSNGMQIEPARWDYDKVGKNNVWVRDSAGHRSTKDGDGSSQYFEIASRWAPGWITSSVVTGALAQAGGSVIGPSVAPIPEPATCMILGLGCIALFRKR